MLNEALDLRAGYIYDQTPDPDTTSDYLIPANNRNIVCMGLGYRWSRWTADVSYSYLMIEDRTIPGRLEDGVWPSEFKSGDAHMFGVSLGTQI